MSVCDEQAHWGICFSALSVGNICFQIEIVTFLLLHARQTNQYQGMRLRMEIIYTEWVFFKHFCSLLLSDWVKLKKSDSGLNLACWVLMDCSAYVWDVGLLLSILFCSARLSLMLNHLELQV